MGEIFNMFVIDVIGVNVRYHFLKLMGREKTREYLRGNSTSNSTNFKQGCLNVIVGFSLFAVIFVGIIYLVYSIV